MLWFWGSVLIHVALGFPFLFAGLIAPLWAVGILVAIWIALGVLLIRTRNNSPRDLWAPVLAAAIWLAAMSLGEGLLSWSA